MKIDWIISLAIRTRTQDEADAETPGVWEGFGFRATWDERFAFGVNKNSRLVQQINTSILVETALKEIL